MEHRYALKCSYMSLTQLSRELTRADLTAPDLFAECSNHLGKVALGGFVNNNKSGSFGTTGPDPETWNMRSCIETGVGPWRRMEPEAALEVCQSLLKRADEDALEAVYTAGGCLDFDATFDTGEDGINTEQLALLDVANWRYSRHPKEHRYALPSYVECDVSPRWGCQQFYFLQEGQWPCRLAWDVLHPENGFMVLLLRPNGVTVAMSYHTIKDAFKALCHRFNLDQEQVIESACDEFGMPKTQFRALVQEAREAIIEVRWRRQVVQTITREVIAA